MPHFPSSRRGLELSQEDCFLIRAHEAVTHIRDASCPVGLEWSRRGGHLHLWLKLEGCAVSHKELSTPKGAWRRCHFPSFEARQHQACLHIQRLKSWNLRSIDCKMAFAAPSQTVWPLIDMWVQILADIAWTYFRVITDLHERPCFPGCYCRSVMQEKMMIILGLPN